MVDTIGNNGIPIIACLQYMEVFAYAMLSPLYDRRGAFNFRGGFHMIWSLSLLVSTNG
jgi:hypothetical protein